MGNEFKAWKNDIQITLNNTTYELKLLPDGWVCSFVPNLRRELADALGFYVDDFAVLQIKEKYGMMRLYWCWKDRDYTADEKHDLSVISKEINTIVEKYEQISTHTCVVCGKEATKMTTGWIMPVCDEHEHL